jgi:hypothetical protein
LFLSEVLGISFLFHRKTVHLEMFVVGLPEKFRLFLDLVNNIFASTTLARENFVKIGFRAKEKERLNYQETHLPPPVA